MRTDHAEGRGPKALPGRREVRCVGEIEHFRPKLGPDGLVNRERLKQRKIPRTDAIGAQVWHGTWRVATERYGSISVGYSSRRAVRACAMIASHTAIGIGSPGSFSKKRRYAWSIQYSRHSAVPGVFRDLSVSSASSFVKRFRRFGITYFEHVPVCCS